MDRHVTKNMKASGNIYPARFVTLDASNPLQVKQSVAADLPYAISRNETKTQVGGIFGTLGVAFEAGDNVDMFGNGTYYELTCGGTVTTGDLLKPDANGKGVLAGAGDYFGARAMQPGATDRIILVEVLMGLRSLDYPTRKLNTTLLATGSAAVTSAMSGSRFLFGAAATATLPAISTLQPGTWYDFVVGTGAVAGAVVIAVNGSDKLKGNGFTATAGKGATQASGVEGATFHIWTDGTDWYGTAPYGTWTRVA